VKLVQPFWHIVAWLTAEQKSLVEPAVLATDWFGVRVPSGAQINVCAAVLDGFALGYSGWALWDYVGGRSRQAVNVGQLETWRSQLAKHYEAVSNFHAALIEVFYERVGDITGAYFKFDATGYRSFIDRNMRWFRNRLSELAALALEETQPGATVARFNDWLLCQGKPKSVTTERIAEKLAAAFKGSTFNVQIEDIA